MSTYRKRIYVVDRVEGETAVLVGDAGEEWKVPVGDLPLSVEEGTVLRVLCDPSGNPDWSAAAVDDTERSRSLDEAKRLLEDLRKRDPGGDISL